jgi:protein involved in polysaccharide export with SLBB domain
MRMPCALDARAGRAELFERIAMFARFAPRALALIAFAISLSACAVGAPATPEGSVDPLPQTTEYRLGPGDKLRVSVFNREELTGEFTVGTQGRISYPLVGEVAVAGQTVPEFTNQLSEQLRNGYVRDPIVSVEIAQYRPFYILGEVNRPGAYPYSPGMTVMGAVATAGGFTYRANSRRVFVQRPGQTGEQSQPLTSSTMIQPGETVRIPERLF